MDGMTMMLKTMGFDPEAIKKNVVDFQENLSKTLAHFDSRLVEIETRLGTLTEFCRNDLAHFDSRLVEIETRLGTLTERNDLALHNAVRWMNRESNCQFEELKTMLRGDPLWGEWLVEQFEELKTMLRGDPPEVTSQAISFDEFKSSSVEVIHGHAGNGH